MELKSTGDLNMTQDARTLFMYSSGINVSDDGLELALKCGIMSIGIIATDRNSKTDFQMVEAFR